MTFASSSLYALKIFFSKTNRGSEKSSGQRSLLGAIICIAVSIIPLVAVISVSNGMISGIIGRMVHLSSQDIQITVNSNSKYADSLIEFNQFSSKFNNCKNVINVYKEVQGMALAAGSSYRSGATLRAVDKDIFLENQYFSSFFNFIEGSADLSKSKNAIIGKKLAEKLNLHVGDNLKIITMKSGSGKIMPKISLFNVTGIVSCGYEELDALWVFIPLENAWATLKNCSLQYYVGLETDKTFSDELETIFADVQKKLLSDVDCMDFYVDTWKNINASQFENFTSTKALLVVIMLAIILAASINISSAIVMVVMERKKEIAILKSTGASSTGITLSFVMTGVLAGISGIIFGIPIGIIISIFINPIIKVIEYILNFTLNIFHAGNIKILDPAFYLQEIPIDLPWREIILIIVSTIVLSIVMSIIPSIQAGKSNISEVLSKN